MYSFWQIFPAFVWILLPLLWLQYKARKRARLLQAIWLLKVLITLGVCQYYLTKTENTDVEYYYQMGRGIALSIAEDPSLVQLILPWASDQDETQLYSTLYLHHRTHFSHTGRRFLYPNASHFLLLRICIVANVLAIGSFWAMNILFTLVAFLGLLLLYKVLNAEGVDSRLAYLVFLLPGSLVWHQGIFKESLVVGLIGLLVFILHKNRWKTRSILLTLASAGLLCWLRPQMMPLLAIGAAFYLLYHRFPDLKRRGMGSLILMGLGLAAVQVLQIGNLNVTEYLQMLGNYSEMRYYIDNPAPSAAQLQPIHMEAGLWGLISYIPQAIYYVLSSPFFLSEKTDFQLFSLFTVFNLATLSYLIIKAKHAPTALAMLLLVVGVLYIVAIGSSVPVVGSMVRYRSVALLCLVAGLLLLGKKKPAGKNAGGFS